MKCTKCRTRLPDEANFCFLCGESLAKGKRQEPDHASDEAGKRIDTLLARIKKIEKEDALRIAENEQRTILDAVPAMIFFKDRENNLIRVNETYARTVGLPKSEIEGQSAFTLTPDRELAEAYWRDDQEVIRSGKPKRHIMEPLLNDNERWFMTDKIPYVDDAGEIIGVIGFSLEITEKRRAEILLLESEYKFNKLVETMLEGFVIQDKENVITYVNDAICRMSGYRKDDLIGEKASKYVSHTTFGTKKEKRKNGKNESYELELFDKKGNKIQVLVSPRTISDRQGNFDGMFSVVTDITHLKKIESSLIEREKELQDKNLELAEMNSVLNILVKNRENDKKNLEETILLNIRNLILPFIEKAIQTDSNREKNVFLNVMKKNLDEITSPLSQRLSSSRFGLTPMEFQIANLTKQGKSAREVGELLNLSHKTVEVHRKHIRKKLGIRNRKVNLRTHLSSLE